MIRTPLKMVKYFYYSGSNRLYYHVFKSPLGFYSSSSFPLSFDLRFYQNLFDEKIGFSKLAEFYSYPDLAFLIKKCYYFGPSNYPYKEKGTPGFRLIKIVCIRVFIFVTIPPKKPLLFTTTLRH